MTEAISIDRLVQERMGQKIHWFSEDVKLNQLAEVMAGMANSNGGKVIIGISPRSQRLLGVRNPEQVIDTIFQSALEISPTLVLPVPEVVYEAGKNYIIAIIPE
ncbi:MAG: hypothetical protein GWN61_24930, partial [candidate division Zixibacteria bacterium]|nr:hypothetical protein [candidate division Zixibacteria bacterium]NIS49113.1 hypothetical protein [candidate division Zixibacteria bacterium]NIU17208.1 hypothetical protein [candidate division Zixibacteria bacterium]NIV09328.1 hypothetical protein [candidate division Zixibacteria bacterium]NIW40018.1 hypothetical protein [candidate division Zixibacteria bacterium]